MSAARKPALSTADREPTPGECARMARDGYLLVRNFFSSERIGQILRWIGELETAPEIRGRHWVYHEDSLTEPRRRLIQRIENFCPFHPGMDHLIRHGALSRWTGKLMGGQVVLFKEKIHFKMPGGLDSRPIRTSKQAGHRYAPRFVTALVTVDPATIENGCLEIVPGRHREGLIGEEWSPLDEAELSLQPVPTAPGDAMFFDSFAPHASKPNFTNAPRRLLYLTYNLASNGDHRAQYYRKVRILPA